MQSTAEPTVNKKTLKNRQRNKRRKDAKLVNKASKQAGANQEKVRELLELWKKTNKNEITSVEDLLQALETVGFWDNFTDSGMGNDTFKEVCGTCPEYKKIITTELFKVFDKNHDGKISIKEFLVGSLQSQDSEGTKEAEMLFDGWDEDSSGTLSKDEIKKLWQTRRSSEISVTTFVIRNQMHNTIITQNQIYVDLFPKVLSAENLEKFAKEKSIKDASDWIEYNTKHEHKCIDETVTKIFEKADTDKSGSLSKEEFIKFFCDTETLKEIRSTARENEEADKVFEERFKEGLYDFLRSSSDPKIKGCGEGVKFLIEGGESPLVSVEEWEIVREACLKTLDEFGGADDD